MAPPTSLGAVEVQKDGRTRMWHSGYIQELVGQSELLVGFESEVRKPPKLSPAELEKFNPRQGDEVELRVNPTPHSPAAWGLATVRNIKHGFYFVALNSVASSERSPEAIVEKDQLRPVTVHQGLGSECLKQEIFKLQASLQSWVTTDDAVGCFAHIEDQSGLVHIQVLPAKPTLKLVGDPKAIARAKMLLEVHLKHQAQIQNFQDVREKRLKALETKRNRIEGAGYKHSVEIQVDPSFIARIIGKGGEAVKSLQERLDVNIRILDAEHLDDVRIIRIFGNSPENVEKARSEVEFVEEALPLDPNMYSWILGRGGKTIQTFRESAGLVYAKLDRDGKQLLLCGSRNSVQDALAMFETHIMYFPVFHQMDEEMEQIFSELEEYGDWDARWEWGCYRDEEEDWQQPKLKAKGSGSGAGKGGAKWDRGGSEKAGKGDKGWDRKGEKGDKGDQTRGGDAQGDAKSGGRGRKHEGKVGESFASNVLEGAAGFRLPKPKTSVDGKGRKGLKDREVRLDDEEPEMEQAAAEEDGEAEPSRKGAGRGGRARAARTGGAAVAVAAVGEAVSGEADEGPRTVRRIGRMGVRA